MHLTDTYKTHGSHCYKRKREHFKREDVTNVLKALADHVREMRAKIQSLGLATWKLLMTPAKDILVARKM